MKKKIHDALLLVLVLISLACFTWLAMYFKEKYSFNLFILIIFSIIVLFILAGIVLIRVVNSRKNTSHATKEIKEPEFKRIVREYEPDMSLVNTPEKAMENFVRCLGLFKILCKKNMSGLDKMSLKEVLEYREKAVSSIEANYLNGEISSWGIRARLHIPNMDEKHCGEYSFLKEHVPVLTTGDHLPPTQEIFDYFVSKFIEKGIVIRFNL